MTILQDKKQEIQNVVRKQTVKIPPNLRYFTLVKFIKSRFSHKPQMVPQNFRNLNFHVEFLSQPSFESPTKETKNCQNPHFERKKCSVKSTQKRPKTASRLSTSKHQLLNPKHTKR